MARPFIAAFDLATATGCADGYPDQKAPRLWSWYLDDAGGERSARLAFLWRFCDAYFQQQRAQCGGVDEVVYELPMNIATIAGAMARGQFRTSEETLGTLRGSIGVLEACAAHHGIKSIRGMDIKDARKHVTGHRTFPKGIDAKAMTMRAVAALGWAPENNNESDAAVLWALAAGQSNPLLAQATRAVHMDQPSVTIGRRPKDPDRGTLFEQKKL